MDMTIDLDRRKMLGTTSALALAAMNHFAGSRPATAAAVSAVPEKLAAQPFLLGLNTSTIRGQKLSIVQVVDIAAKAGYRGLEPWIDELDRHVAAGHSLDDLRKQIADSGISVESAIGFFDWVVDDPARRKKGLESARRAMDLVKRIGGKRVAAPPVGATDHRMLDLRVIADRYRDLLAIGDETGVVPQVEVWGFSQTLGRLSEAAMVAIETGHPQACVLPDVYHLYRGGSEFGGVSLLAPRAIHVFHFNDFPATPARDKITDADRVFPGDGIAPIPDLLKNLKDGGFQVMLSLELFNRKLWEQDPLVVARTGYQKLKTLVDSV